MWKANLILGTATLMLAPTSLLAASSSGDTQECWVVKVGVLDASKQAATEYIRAISQRNDGKPALHRVIDGNTRGVLRLAQAHDNPNGAWVEDYSGDDDEERIEVRVENGQVRVWINGKEVDAGDLQIQNDDGHVIILDGEGQEMHDLPFDFKFDGPAFEWGGDALRGQLRGFLNRDDNEMRFFGAAGEQPRVMVGIVMDAPSEPLRLHLGLAEGECTIINRVIEGLPADEAGLAKFDIVVAVNGKSPASAGNIHEAIQELDPGDDIQFTVIHKGKKRTITITAEKYDAKVMSQSNTFFFAPDGQFPGRGGPFEIMGDAPLAEILELRELGKLRQFSGPESHRRIIVAPRADREHDRELILRERRERDKNHDRNVRSRPDRDRHFGDDHDRLSDIDDRIRRLEKLLEKLVEQAHGDR